MNGDKSRYSQVESLLQWKPRRKVRPVFSRLLTLALIFLAVAIAARTTVLTDIRTSISSYFRVPDSKIRTGSSQISNLKTALETFETDNGRYPTTEEGLEALVIRPPGAGGNWHKQMDEIPLDQWGHAFRYRFPSMRGAESYDLDSAGPDGIFDTTDDIHMESHFQ